MEARCHLKRWRMTGVWPRGAQVRRTTGSSEAPLSSQNTMVALRRRAFLPDPWPVAGHPPLDRLLVAFGGAAGGALQPVAHAVAQQLPDVSGMVGDPGELLDHGRHALKRPVVAVEAVRAGTLAQRLVDGVKLGVVKARGLPGGAGAAQRVGPTLAPLGVPAAGVLAGDAEGVGDLGLGVAGGEQLAGLHADAFEGLAVAQTAGVASVGGWSHTAMLPECRRNARGSFKCFLRIRAAWSRSSSPTCQARNGFPVWRSYSEEAFRADPHHPPPDPRYLRLAQGDRGHAPPSRPQPCPKSMSRRKYRHRIVRRSAAYDTPWSRSRVHRLRRAWLRPRRHRRAAPAPPGRRAHRGRLLARGHRHRHRRRALAARPS